VTIVPDTKDWTWVLGRPSPDCGLDAHGFARDAIAGMIRRNAWQWQEVLAGPGDKARRPSPGAWSALGTPAMSVTCCGCMTSGSC